MAEKYYHPAGRHRTEIIVVNSRFITTIAPVETAPDARAFIHEIREEMPDASHHVYAFRAGYGNSVTEGMSDDGEPSGTSGPPTLAVLRGSDIGDIALVTTRYFGGTKLGTGGLVRAYSESARTALESLQTELKAPRLYLGMDVSYALYDQVKRLIENYDIALEEEIFAADITLLFTILEEQIEEFEAALTELSAGQILLIRL